MSPALPDEHEAQIEAVVERARREDVRFADLQFIDVVGVIKSVTIPASQFEDCLRHGKWFDGSSIEGFARTAESDMYLKPDLDTFAVVPWERDNPTARVICDVLTPRGERFGGDPRAVLRNVLREAEEMGFDYVAGPELEFFLFRAEEVNSITPLPHDRGGYFDFSTDLAYNVRKEMVNALESLGVRVETSHHELAPGQHEIDFQPDVALRTADSVVTARYALKAIAEQHALHATFMPKPVYAVAGSGLHIHQSLSDRRTHKNAFAEPDDEYGLSDLAKQFVAGQLAHARGMEAVLAPLVNSYKRVVPGFEAPVYVSWARVNRSALVRVPHAPLGRGEATRIELRSPDASCNPYLALAVMLKAGLDGVRRHLNPPEPLEETLYGFAPGQRARQQVEPLPTSLGEALEAVAADPLMREALGDHVYERFLEAKRQEWDEYRQQVFPWELQRYLPVF